MFDAQLLKNDQSVYSPWLQRGGDNMLATLEVIEIEGTGATIKVEVWTKKAEDAGNGDDADSTNSTNISRTSPGRTTQEWGEEESSNIALLDLVRYKFTVTTTSGDGWVLFRMLAPVWFDSVETTV